MFRIFQEDTPKVDPKKSQTSQSPKTLTSPTSIIPTASSVPGTSDFDKHIDEAIKAANVPGPDYLEFIAAVNSPSVQSLPEPTRYVSVFAGFSAQGVSKDSLTKAALHYVDVVEKDKVSVETYLDNMIKKEVDGRQAQMTTITNNNATISQQISDLQTKLESNKQQALTLETEMNAQSLNIEGKRKSYEAAYENRKAIIQTHINNINTFIS